MTVREDDPIMMSHEHNRGLITVAEAPHGILGIGDGPAMGARVLLVEDDPSSQAFLRTLCERRGDRVDVAADGFMGLRLLSERRHDVVLIDYHLPEMDGYALARLMREVARHEGGTRLVGITADRHGLTSRRGADTLFDAILIKPVEPRDLFTTLDRLTRRQVPTPAAGNEGPAAGGSAVAGGPIAQGRVIVEDGATASADRLWRRRGLARRPRAVLCPALAPCEVEAVSQVFEVVGHGENADVILVGSAGLADLRALRATGTAYLLPAVALDRAWGSACDLVFDVRASETWTALAQACLGFAARRNGLRRECLAARDAASRLLALLAVCDRRLYLAAPQGGGISVYETGLAPDELIAAVLALAETGKLTCEPSSGGVEVRLTETGHRSLMRDGSIDPAQGTSTEERWCPGWGQTGTAPSPPEARQFTGLPLADAPTALPLAVEGAGPTTILPDIRAGSIPIVNARKIEELRLLIGPKAIASLRRTLLEMLDQSFLCNIEPPTLRERVHNLISMAGNLGFDRLAESCRDLEVALSTGRDVQACLRDVSHNSDQIRSLCERG